MDMPTLIVQPASTRMLHLYAPSSKHFELTTPAQVLPLEGVRAAHLVTTGRPRGRWCLVLEPTVAIEQRNAAELARLVHLWATALGFHRVRLVRPAERQDGGLADDIYDWLKW